MDKAKEIIRLVDLAKIDEKSYIFRGADCIVVTKDNKIILQRRGDNWQRFPGYLASFGGQIEAGETPMQALVRELNEELGAKVKESDVVLLGAVTEAVTGHTELIYVYFWHDLHGTITGCYEGKVRYFDSVQEVMRYPKVMDDTRWALNECMAKQLLKPMKLADSNVEVIKWNKEIEREALELLNQHKETSFFLLSNLNTYGTKLTDGTYSADFKCLVKEGKVVGVFALTKAGNLIVQTDRAYDYAKIIIDECLKGKILLKGVVGDWELAKPIWDCAKRQILTLKETLCGKEILLQLILSNLSELKCKHEVQHLKPLDYPVWDQLNKAYMQEGNLDQREDEKARHNRFLQDVENRYWYGLFIDTRLVSIACGISNIDDVVWIGGVYTLPEMRGQRLATEVMYKLLLDCKVNKLKSQAILFADESNIAAIKVYEGLGFKRIGYFGLFFGSYKE